MLLPAFLPFLLAMLATLASASRISTVQFENETLAGYGKPCDCYDKIGDQWKENKCCGTGFLLFVHVAFWIDEAICKINPYAQYPTKNHQTSAKHTHFQEPWICFS